MERDGPHRVLIGQLSEIPKQLGSCFMPSLRAKIIPESEVDVAASMQRHWRVLPVLALGGLLPMVLAPSAGYGGTWVKTNKGCVVWNSDPKPGETATWTGACADGKVSGNGKLTWKNGSQA